MQSLTPPSPSPSPFKLKAKFKPCGDQPQAIEKILQGLQCGKKRHTLLGVTGSGKTFTMAHIIQRLGKKTLVLAPNKTLAAQLFAEFREFFPDNAVEFFVSYYDYYRPEAYVASTDTYIEKDSAVNDEIDKLRHSTTRSLLEREDCIVVASVSCIYGIGSPDEYEEHKITYFVGDLVERDELLRHLVDIQYERNDIEFSRGTFRVRGDTVEVFPAYEDAQVIRLEFFDRQLEGIYMVDPLRGSILGHLHKITIYPSSHYVVGKERLKVAIREIKKELLEREQQLELEGKLVEKQRIGMRTRLDVEMMEEMGFCSGIENYSRHITQTPAGEPPPTLVDFFKKDFLLVVDESHITVPQVGAMYRGDRARKMSLVEHGFRLPSALDNRPLRFEEFDAKLNDVVYVSATPGTYELEQCQGEIVEQIIRPTGLLDPVVEVRSADHQVDDLLIEVKKVVSQGGRVLVTTLTKKLAEELASYYRNLGIKICYLHSDVSTLERMEILRDLRLGKYDVLVGINLLREGLDLPEVVLVGILDADREGFLRSVRSLIQTMGRAARNVDGRVILYAYGETKSMQAAIRESNRRRKIQQKYNEKHGITPSTIQKEIHGGVIDVLAKGKGKNAVDLNKKKDVKTPQDLAQLEQKIQALRQQMQAASRQLRFEEAAQLRDEIRALSELRLLL